MAAAAMLNLNGSANAHQVPCRRFPSPSLKPWLKTKSSPCKWKRDTRLSGVQLDSVALREETLSMDSYILAPATIQGSMPWATRGDIQPGVG